MAKTIKFNLICDEKPVRTIEDLQNNFSIEDILAYYNNQLLHRWLRVRGYDAELKAVSAITVDEPMKIVKELIRIFDIVADEQKVEEDVYIFTYLKEREKQCALYKQEGYKTERIIKDYEAGYRKLVEGILEHPKDAAFIKANISEIVSNYAWILKLNHRDLFYVLKEKSMLTIMCLLMNKKSRDYFLPVEITDELGNVELDTKRDADKKKMFLEICKMIKCFEFDEILGENLITFAGETDGYWKDLKPKGKQYMIISMGEGDYVRAAGHLGGDLSSSNVLNGFVILDGIDYKSNSNTRQLVYMEV